MARSPRVISHLSLYCVRRVSRIVLAALHGRTRGSAAHGAWNVDFRHLGGVPYPLGAKTTGREVPVPALLPAIPSVIPAFWKRQLPASHIGKDGRSCSPG